MSQPLILHIDVFVGTELRERRAFIDPARILIGRSTEADIRFNADDRTVSSAHAEIVRTEGGFLLRDLQSRNGLYKLASAEKFQELPLQAGDSQLEIALGPDGAKCVVSVGCAIPFADYLVTGRLGEGGMATVFLAQESTQLSRLVVLKLIAPSLLLSIDPDDAKAMLQEEARIAGFVSHPNVVNILKADCYEGTHFIAMEYLKGVNLGAIQRQLVRQGTRCPFPLAAALVSQACAGLHAAHEARDSTGRPLGIIHRDFTPSNIVCSPEGDVKLIDFGVARALGRRYLSSGGQFVGKPAYASPEQIKHPQDIDRRSDVFAAGVILYELCTGLSLFLRENDFATLAAVMSAPVPPIPDAPPQLADILMRALSRDPRQRPASAAAFAEELEHFALGAGGQHLQRRSMAQALTRLGVDLRAPSPRALSGRPTLLPAPPERQRSRAVPAPMERLPQSDRIGSEVRNREGRELPPRDSAPVEKPRLPAEIVLSGESVRIGRQIRQQSSGAEAPFTHACYEVVTAQSAQSAQLGESAPRVLHLVGGRSVMDPVDEHLAAPLRQLIARWQSWEQRGPLCRLILAGDAWPGGPLALLIAECPAEQTWAARAASCAETTAARLRLVHALIGCVTELLRSFPGFVHGALAPDRIQLSESGDPPQLLFGTGFDWLLADPQGQSALKEYLLTPYCAPELQQGAPATQASDVFAVAALGYELLGGNLAEAALALLSGRLVPPLPLHTRLPASARSGLLQALHPDPGLRPTAAALHRALASEEDGRPRALLEQIAPPAGESAQGLLPGGRRLFLYTMLLSRSMSSEPARVPFGADLCPASFGLSLFRGRLAVELLTEPTPMTAIGGRSRLYQAADSVGTERLFLLEDAGAFAVGSRSHHRLQQVEFSHVITRPETAIELAPLGLRIRPAQAGHALLLWTRELRSGDVHVLCAHITE